MKKILLLLLLSFLTLAAYSSTEEKNIEREVKDGNPQWWKEIGETDSEYWWVNEYQDEDSN
ncbi:hypothetical protein NRK67_17120 (plasmid) [Fusobacteria bacterium ZRK30]|nr:hypothetical protein NRK67_17120 [Fusobacteria bacterium ZRK30]